MIGEDPMKSHRYSSWCRSAVAVALAGMSAPAAAAFFQIAENSASGIGNAFAGGAALAEDASTVWYNPAGMMRLKGPQFVASGHYIVPSFKASVNSASTALGSIGGGGGEAGEAALVPNLYATYPVGSRLALGAGINAPFGLATNYDSTWAGRYYALRSDIKSVNLNLAGAFKFHDALSAGLGINGQHLDAELSQAVDFATLCTGAILIVPGAGACGLGGGFSQPNNPNDGKAKVNAKGDAWGYNAGILVQLGATRIGLAYRSKMKYKLDGTFDMTAPANVPAALLTNSNFRLVDSGARADVTLPATASISVYQNLGSVWAVMADVTRTYWSVLPELRIKFDSGQSDQVVTFNLKDVNRYSIGATYKANASWVLRTGVALDKSPVSSPTTATPRLPDSDRRWLSVGAGLQASARLNFDFAYTYIKLAGSSVTKTDLGAGTENALRGNLSADYKGSVQIFSTQARWTF
jgi:long-chain fatty acid transport protein